MFWEEKSPRKKAGRKRVLALQVRWTIVAQKTMARKILIAVDIAPRQKAKIGTTEVKIWYCYVQIAVGIIKDTVKCPCCLAWFEVSLLFVPSVRIKQKALRRMLIVKVEAWITDYLRTEKRVTVYDRIVVEVGLNLEAEHLKKMCLGRPLLVFTPKQNHRLLTDLQSMT